MAMIDKPTLENTWLETAHALKAQRELFLQVCELSGVQYELIQDAIFFNIDDVETVNSYWEQLTSQPLCTSKSP